MIRRLGHAVAWIEDAALVLVLLALIGLATTEIVLRNVFDTGLVWAPELTRLMVLWLALLGAVVASRSDRHIRIDVLARLLPPRGRLVVTLLVDVFTIGVLALLCFHSARFVLDAYEFEDTLLEALPAWWFQIILPIGFGLMVLHQLVLAFARLMTLAGRPIAIERGE
ncbi:MAG: TRAP transporter small permease [Pseudomonadota bacterium]